jgi:hemerythrin-like domain-containing protein
MVRLRLDHARLSRVLREVEVQRARLQSHAEAAKPVLADATQYLLDYQHAFHHPREDRLFELLAARRPELRAEVKALGREHRGGLRHAEQLAAKLGHLGARRLRGSAGERLGRELQQYVDRTREHMRREERAVFYAGVESMLEPDDWIALGEDDAREDPMGDAARFAHRYPSLAAAVGETFRELSSGTRIRTSHPHGAAAQTLAAAEEGMERLVEAYGDLLHEGLALARANLDSVWNAGSPLAAARALPEVGRRSIDFAARCFMHPARVTLELGSRLAHPWLPAPTTRPGRAPTD